MKIAKWATIFKMADDKVGKCKIGNQKFKFAMMHGELDITA